MALLNTANAVRLGAAAASRVYAGAVQVWPAVASPPLMAHRVDWPGWSKASAFTAPGTAPLLFQVSSTLGGGISYNGGGAVPGDAIAWDFDVSAGTYRLTVIIQTEQYSGIYTVRVDGVSVGTFDGYAGGDNSNVVNTLAGLVLSAGLHRVELLLATKNPAALSYRYRPQWLSLERTGA